MKCQRCSSGEAAYRVHTDAIDMKVCAACGAEARRLGIAVEVLIGGEGKVNGGRVSLNFRITGQLLPVVTAIKLLSHKQSLSFFFQGVER